PWLPHALVPAATWTLPALMVTPHAMVTEHANGAMDGSWVLPALWSIGALSCAARLVFLYTRLARGARRGEKSWLSALHRAAPALDLRRVRVHADGPAVLWAPRTRILLPPDFLQRFDAPARAVILRHECAHVARGDAAWTLLAELACALLWWHPLAWLALPRFRLDMELACDARVLRQTPEHSADYARTLFDSVAVRPCPTLIPWLAEPQLKERIAMITRIQPGALRRRAGFLAIAAVLTGGLLIAGGETPVQAATHASKASTPPSVDVTAKNANPPKYPEEALVNKHQGMVILDVTVDAAGAVKGVSIDPKTDAPSELQTSALQAAAGWKFNPGSKNGKPVGGVVQVPVNFALIDADAANTCPAGDIFDVQTSKCIPDAPHYVPPAPAH
ncbi:MAG: M56 family metallopeptidase, partial [Proteobacteria bacterium]|nr:M56 family metallopeptidase [Pseudomonadota bacterium]